MRAPRYCEHPATCRRMMGNWLVGWHCGAEMQLVVTQNPTRLPYEHLIVTRCTAGHIESGTGVLVEHPEPHSADDLGGGC